MTVEVQWLDLRLWNSKIKWIEIRIHSRFKPISGRSWCWEWILDQRPGKWERTHWCNWRPGRVSQILNVRNEDKMADWRKSNLLTDQQSGFEIGSLFDQQPFKKSWGQRARWAASEFEVNLLAKLCYISWSIVINKSINQQSIHHTLVRFVL